MLSLSFGTTGTISPPGMDSTVALFSGGVAFLYADFKESPFYDGYFVRFIKKSGIAG
jgi:hypothetical protein